MGVNDPLLGNRSPFTRHDPDADARERASDDDEFNNGRIVYVWNGPGSLQKLRRRSIKFGGGER